MSIDDDFGNIQMSRGEIFEDCRGGCLPSLVLESHAPYIIKFETSVIEIQKSVHFLRKKARNFKNLIAHK